MREICLHWMYLFQAISSNFGFCGRKDPPPRMREKFVYTGCIHFRQFWATLVFVAEKPTPQDEGKDFYTRSIHFGQFWATLVFVAEKPPALKWGKHFLHWMYPFQAILSNFGFCSRKAHPPSDEGKFVYTGSIHFRLFWATLVLWQKSSPPLGWGRFFLHWIYPFQAILSNFGFCGRKALTQDEGKFVYTGCIHFRQFWATLVLWQKSPPPQMREICLHWMYLFQAISSNFGFCGRKPDPPRMRENFILHWMYPFQAISSNFGFCGRKASPPPPPRMREKIFTLDLSISGNFEQLWFLWQKSPPPPPQDEGNFFTLDLSISGNFEQLWFLWQKSAPPPPPITTRDERPLAGYDHRFIIDFGLVCLTSANLAIHLHWPHYWLMLVLCINRTLSWGNYYHCEKKFAAHPSLKWLTFAQYKHEPKVKAVRVHGQIIEVE